MEPTMITIKFKLILSHKYGDSYYEKFGKVWEEQEDWEDKNIFINYIKIFVKNVVNVKGHISKPLGCSRYQEGGRWESGEGGWRKKEQGWRTEKVNRKGRRKAG